MAEPDLIERYLAELGRSLRGRPDVVDLLAEVEDHLRETADRLCHAGTDSHDAQCTTLDRFGESTVVARAYAVNLSGGLAMPTKFTRTAGAIALVTAALWSLAAIVKWWESELFAAWTQARSWVFTVVVVLAALGTVVVLAGIVVRTGKGHSLSAAALVLGGLAVVAFGVMPWAFALWGLLLTAAFLVALPALHSVTEGRGIADWALVAAWPAGLGVMWLLSALRVGPVDEYGDHQVAFVAGFGTSAVLMTIGLISVGRRLLAEQVEVPSRPMLQV